MVQKRGSLLFNPITILVCLILMVAAFYFFVFRTDAVRPPCQILTPFSCDEVGFRVFNNSITSVLLNMTYIEGGYGGIVYSIRSVEGELALAGCSYDTPRRIRVLGKQQYELACKYPLLPTSINSVFFVEYDKVDPGEIPLDLKHTVKGTLRIVDLGVVLKKANQTYTLSLNS